MLTNEFIVILFVFRDLLPATEAVPFYFAEKVYQLGLIMLMPIL